MTKEECIALLKRYAEYNGMGIHNLAECREAMRTAAELLAQPSLPSNLDEAAQQDAIRTYAMPEDGNIDKVFKVQEARTFHEIGFKACAKWIHGKLDGKLDDSTVNEWASHFSPEIRDSIKSTAYHFWNIARLGVCL